MIILDTNIWYRISEGVISKDSFDEQQVCLTATVLLEIMGTNRWKTEESKMVKALETILEIDPTYIPQTHYGFIANKILGCSPNEAHALGYDCIERKLGNGYSVEENNFIINTLKEYKKKFVENYIETVQRTLNDESLVAKLKNEEECKLVVFNDVMLEVEKQMQINRKDVNRDYVAKEGANLDFYLLTRKAYYLKTMFEGKKPDENDIFDLFHLAYIGLEDLYWTRDFEWAKKYMADSFVSQFLYIEPVSSKL
jgi:hypothetical protein